MEASEIITHLGLIPLRGEGGYYRETYRCGEMIQQGALPQRYGSEKSFCSAIYYLITSDSFSVIHRVHTDEIFHFYMGDPAVMLMLYPDGNGETVTLGSSVGEGHRPQCVVPRGTWQGLRVVDGGSWTLFGTTMAPAFDFSDFELGESTELTEQYPGYADLVSRYTGR